MILLDLDTLASKLRDDELSERDKFNYAVLLAIFWSLAGPTGVLALPPNVTVLIVYAVVIAVFLIGLITCYKVNERGDGRAFVERLVVLGGPVGLRMLLITNAAWFAVLFFVGQAKFISTWSASKQLFVSAVIQLIAYILGVLWLRGAMDIASSGPKQTSGPIERGNQALEYQRSNNG